MKCNEIYNWIVLNLIAIFNLSVKKVKLATIAEDDQKAPFSIATTLRCKGGRYSFTWIVPLYPWYSWVLSKEVSSTNYKVFDMTRPGIEPRSPEHSTHWANEPVANLSVVTFKYLNAAFTSVCLYTYSLTMKCNGIYNWIVLNLITIFNLSVINFRYLNAAFTSICFLSLKLSEIIF